MYRADLVEQWDLLNLTHQRSVRSIVTRGTYTDVNALLMSEKRTEQYTKDMQKQIKHLLKSGHTQNKKEADRLQDQASMAIVYNWVGAPAPPQGKASRSYDRAPPCPECPPLP